VEFVSRFPVAGRWPVSTSSSSSPKKADALRFDSLFVTDHVVMPVSSAKSVYPYTTSGQFPGGPRRTISSARVLSHLAHATRRTRLGISVLVVPYRNPLLARRCCDDRRAFEGSRVSSGPASAGCARVRGARGAPFEERGPVTEITSG